SEAGVPPLSGGPRKVVDRGERFAGRPPEGSRHQTPSSEGPSAIFRDLDPGSGVGGSLIRIETMFRELGAHNPPSRGAAAEYARSATKGLDYEEFVAQVVPRPWYRRPISAIARPMQASGICWAGQRPSAAHAHEGKADVRSDATQAHAPAARRRQC